MTGPRPFRLTGRHVLIAILGFFGIVIAVNLAFVFLALDSWTGLTDHDSYRTGVSWNQTLERDDAQKALGWTTDIETQVKTGVAGDRRFFLTLTVTDKAGMPVNGLAIDGMARHPVAEAKDRPIAVEARGDGVYLGRAELPSAGDWGIRLIATRPDGSTYRIDTLAVVR
ncbi:MAG: FixH family protein [Alphaproteobacteria bacterium]|nr:FixH family protein [Alphaproteobacteria bacterium]